MHKVNLAISVSIITDVSVLLSIQYIMTCMPVHTVVVSVYPSSPFLSSVDDHSLLHIEIITSTMLQCSCCLSLNITSSAIHHYTLTHIHIHTLTHTYTHSHTHTHTHSHTYTYTHTHTHTHTHSHTMHPY